MNPPSLRLRLQAIIVIFLISLTLLAFQAIFWILLPLNKRLYERSVYLGQGVILAWLRLFGVRIEGRGNANARSAILVSNHQSILDIPLLSWFLRQTRPRFIAKRQLGRFIPSVSHALRHLGSALIDRSNPVEALRQIEALGERAAAEGFSVVIFPEGTRSSDASLRPFKTAGLQALMKRLPGCPIIPVAISGSASLMNTRPRVPVGHIRVTICPALPPDLQTIEEVVERCRRDIEAAIDSRA